MQGRIYPMRQGIEWTFSSFSFLLFLVMVRNLVTHLIDETKSPLSSADCVLLCFSYL